MARLWFIMPPLVNGNRSTDADEMASASEFRQKYNWPRGGVSASQERRNFLGELGLRGDGGFLNLVLELIICINPAKSPSFLSY